MEITFKYVCMYFYFNQKYDSNSEYVTVAKDVGLQTRWNADIELKECAPKNERSRI